MTAGQPGEDAWVRRLLTEHEGPLTRYALRLTGNLEAARDAVQETFLRLCRQQPGDLIGHEVAWLYRVCRQRAIDAGRKERRMSLMDHDQAAECESDVPAPSAASESVETDHQLLRMLATLPAQQQEALRLKFQAGLKYRDIAEVMGLSTNHVGVLIHTAIKKLRELLASDVAPAANE